MFLACTALFLVAFFGRWLEGHWYTPGTFFTSFWIFAAIPACLSNVPVNPAAIFLVATFCLACVAGSALGLGSRVEIADGVAIAHRARPMKMNRRLLRTAVLLAGVAGLLTPLLLMLSEGRSPAQLLQFSEWIRFAAEITVARYRNDYTEPLIVRGLMTATYLGALAGGLLLRFRQTRDDVWVAITPVFAACAASLATTAKSTFLLTIVLMASAFIASSFLFEGQAKRGSGMRSLLRLGFIGFAVLGIFVGSMLMRYQSDRPDALGVVLHGLATYAFGHMSALSAWLEIDGFAGDELTFGAYTFAGPVSVLGFFQRTVGIYTEVHYNDYTVPSNVFTIFRGLISDAGFAGALIFVALVAFLAGRAVRAIRTSQAYLMPLFVLTTFYSVTLWSHVISIFTYNSLAAALVAYALMCAAVLRTARTGAPGSDSRGE